MSEEALNKKIKELEEKLSKLDRILTEEAMEKDQMREKNPELPEWMEPEKTPVEIEEYDIHDIMEARNTSEKRAMLTETDDVGYSGDVTHLGNYTPIHNFDNLKECLCKCHPRKTDCMYCYDHPTHLNTKTKIY